jgi:hypothetical protein
VSRSVKELKHGGRVPPGPAFGAWETTTLRCPLHIITPRRRTIERCRIRDIPGPICQEWVWIVTRKLPIHSYPTFFLCFSRNTLKINRLGIIFSETKAKLEPLRSTILGKGRMARAAGSPVPLLGPGKLQPFAALCTKLPSAGAQSKDAGSEISPVQYVSYATGLYRERLPHPP